MLRKTCLCDGPMACDSREHPRGLSLLLARRPLAALQSALRSNRLSREGSRSLDAEASTPRGATTVGGPRVAYAPVGEIKRSLSIRGTGFLVGTSTTAVFEH